MFTARKVPRACQSCRLQLLYLFEYGFAGTTPRVQYSTRPSFRSLQPRHEKGTFRSTSTRCLSTTSKRAEKVNPTAAEQNDAADIESVVREARQTFGNTLPKDYLSREEYVLYERLYGPPLRETSAEDLEFLPQGEEAVESGDRVLRANADGEYEELDYDPEFNFSIRDEEDVEAAGEEVLYEAGVVEEALADFEPGEEAVYEEGIEGLETAEFDGEDQLDIEDGILSDEALAEAHQLNTEAVLKSGESIHIHGGKNQREIDAIARLQKDMNEAMFKPAKEEEEDECEEEYEELEEETEEDEEDEPGQWISSDSVRTHPHTMTGRMRTFPVTISLPREQLLEPISELLERTNMAHLTKAAEEAFGGKGLPYSASTPGSMKHLPQKHVGLDPFQHKMSEIEADAYLAVVLPGTYASVMSTLVEVRKRLGSQWIRDLLLREGGQGPKILDAGAGGAGIIAWREISQAEWDVMKEEGIVEKDRVPYGKSTVLTASNTLRHRVSRFLEDTTFLPRLPDYIHASNSEAHIDGAPAQGRKVYDIIVAPHTLFPLKEEFRRKNMVQNLWSLLNPNGGVLIMIEKGLPRGFEAIAGARDLLLKWHIASPGDSSFENEIQSPLSENSRFTEKEEGMIIAPCTNHKDCPMYPVPGLSLGRKDFCHFPQRLMRPNFMQRILGAKTRNHEDIKYSYVAVRRGVDGRKDDGLLQGDKATMQAFEGYEDHDLPRAEWESPAESNDVKFNSLSLPRIVLSSIKSRGHITLDLCTPSAKLERWVVPRSFSKAAYRDARKSKWGDLWALGAKTRTIRSPRLGRPGESGKGVKVKGIRDGKMGKGGKKMKKTHYDMVIGRTGADIKEAARSAKFPKDEKRTKGGRFLKERRRREDDDM